MGWRFRKRIKILPGVHINLSGSGVSTSIGVRGAEITVGPHGTRETVGLPGTGVSYTQTSSKGKQSQGSVAGAIGVVLVVFIVFCLAWFVGKLVLAGSA